MTCFLRFISLTILATLVLTTGPSQAGQETTIDGILYVTNDAPRDGHITPELTEIWRAGGDDDEDVLFGVIGQVRVDALGNLYFLDFQMSTAHMFTAEGEYVGQIGRAGDGPGELRGPADMILLDNGQVGMLQTFPGKVVTTDIDNSNPGGFQLGGADATQADFKILRTGQCRAGSFVFGATSIDRTDNPAIQDRVESVARYDDQGNQTVVYHSYTHRVDFQNFTFRETEQMNWAIRRFDIGPDQRVYCAPERDEYTINVYNADGSMDRVIQRDFEPRQRTPEVKQTLVDRYEAAMRQIPGATVEIGDTEPVIGWEQNCITLDPNGNVWVLSADGLLDHPDGVMQTYDVFSSEGHLLKEVSFAIPGDNTEDVMFIVGTDMAVLVTGFFGGINALVGGGDGDDAGDEDEPSPTEVVCYRF